jgi:hypothetical protein
MQDHYQLIKRGRAMLATVPKGHVHDSTAADYLRKVRRLNAGSSRHGGGLFDGAIAEALKTAKKSTWQACRAALLSCARNGLEDYLTEQDKMQRGCKALEHIAQPAPWES